MDYLIKKVKEDWNNRTAQITLSHDGVDEEYNCDIDVVDRLAVALGRDENDDNEEPAPFYIEGKTIDMDLYALNFSEVIGN